MILAHYEPLSLTDYPGRLATTVFTVGCNFACPYCHNPELVVVTPETPHLAEDVFFDYLRRRTGKLNGVCISGGEPTIHPDLPRFVERIHALGYAVKLDTNGSNPPMLASLLNDHSIDYVAMDVKAPPARYAAISGCPGADVPTLVSIRLLSSSPVAHEFRTTVLPSLFDEEDIDGIADILPDGSVYFLQNFVPVKTLNHGFVNREGFDQLELSTIACRIQERHPLLNIRTRGAL